MSTQSVIDLLGEDLAGGSLGENLITDDLIAGYIPERAVVYQPPMQLGDGLAGPLNDQQLYIGRDDRPIATDELGMQGPFMLSIGAIARHRAGRSFPLNLDWNEGLDDTLPGLIPEDAGYRAAPLSPGGLPGAHDGVPAVELVENPRTVFYTASPSVGWAGY
ncbi:MAG TPA: hypothetical protein VG371_14505 [Solirubrobacteraceae bacterium]|nr:hypothetical protein [Solirubrobacteraceae bacterium]